MLERVSHKLGLRLWIALSVATVSAVTVGLWLGTDLFAQESEPAEVPGPVVAENGRPDAELLEASRQFGLARQGDQTPAVQVDGRTVTAAELEATRTRIRSNVEFMRSVIADQDPEPVAEEVAERLAIIERAGVDNVALAAQIIDSSLMAKALREGHSVDEAEISATIAQMKQLAEDGEVPEIAGAAEVLGETYWDEILPELVRAQRLFESLQAEAIRSGVPGPHGAKDLYRSLERSAIDEAEIEILDDALVGDANLPGALAYLEEYWALGSA